MATVFAKEKKTAVDTSVDRASESDSSEVPELGVARAQKRFWYQRTKDFDKNAIATQPSVFDDPDLALKFHPPESWENYHRFDPNFRWTWGEESRLVRKIDLLIMVWACIMFVALELDRANLTAALTDDFLVDLNMTTNDYNLGNTVFKVAFLAAELPSQLVSKWAGPDRWIPAQITIWSGVAMAQFGLTGKTSFLVTRALLGALQGGLIPDVILYLSYFFKHHELSIRLGFFWTAMNIADIISNLLGYGLLHLRGVHGRPGWAWLFLLEGLLTFIIGLASFVMMPAGPCQTANWSRGKKGWFSEREEKIIVNRVLREDPSKSQMHNREPITPRLLWQSLKDYDLWPLYILGLVFQIPIFAPGAYMTLSLRGLGFNTFQSNLLAIPYTVARTFNMLILTYLAEVWNELTLTSSIQQIWVLPFLIYLFTSYTATSNKWVIFGVTTGLLSYPLAHPIQVGWNSRNSNSVRLRTVSAACYNMFVQAGSIIGANIYRTDDAPLYRRGNKQLIAITCMNLVIYVLTKAYYVWRNRSRAAKWDAMTNDERLNYIENTTDEGNKRLDFRFHH